MAQARALGLVTSLVTNGALLSEDMLVRLGPVLDWLTISVDSLNAETNRRIGRASGGVTLSADDYLARVHSARALGVNIKINTVVNAANLHENFTAFLRLARPKRWKLFQATRIAEENGDEFSRWRISEAAFRAFVSRHWTLEAEGIVPVPETQADIYGTYAMIGPNGCFFDNSRGTYRYSTPIMDVGIEAAWAEIAYSEERFRARHGDYDFATGLNRVESFR